MLTVILGGVNMGQHLFGGVLTHTVLTVFQRWNESAVGKKLLRGSALLARNFAQPRACDSMPDNVKMSEC